MNYDKKFGLEFSILINPIIIIETFIDLESFFITQQKYNSHIKKKERFYDKTIKSSDCR